MLIEMRTRSQITLPSEILKNLGLRPGDKLEVIEKDGGIFLCPVVIYPKKEIERIAELIRDAEAEPSKAYESIENMFKDLGLS